MFKVLPVQEVAADQATLDAFVASLGSAVVPAEEGLLLGVGDYLGWALVADPGVPSGWVLLRPTAQHSEPLPEVEQVYVTRTRTVECTFKQPPPVAVRGSRSVLGQSYIATYVSNDGGPWLCTQLVLYGSHVTDGRPVRGMFEACSFLSPMQREDTPQWVKGLVVRSCPRDGV